MHTRHAQRPVFMLYFQKFWQFHGRWWFFAPRTALAAVSGRELLAKRLGLALWFHEKRKKTKGDMQSGAFRLRLAKLRRVE
jgi:hypothetical protein